MHMGSYKMRKLKAPAPPENATNRDYWDEIGQIGQIGQIGLFLSIFSWFKCSPSRNFWTWLWL